MKNKKGNIEAVILIVVFLVLAGILVYLLINKLDKDKLPLAPSITQNQAQTQVGEDTSNLDLDNELDSIQLDLPDADIKEIDKDLEIL